MGCNVSNMMSAVRSILGDVEVCTILIDVTDGILKASDACDELGTREYISVVEYLFMAWHLSLDEAGRTE
jgi:hypothetical protein